MPQIYKPKYIDKTSPLYDEAKAMVWRSKHEKGQTPITEEEARVKLAAQADASVPATVPPTDAIADGHAKEKMTPEEIKAIIPDWKSTGASIQEARFAAEYCANGFDATSAYLTAVNSCVKKSTAMQLGARMLSREGVAKCITEYSTMFIGGRLLEVRNKIMDTFWAQAFYDPATFINPDGSPVFTTWDDVPPNLRSAILSIKTKVYGKDADREVIEIELADRRPAIKELTAFLKVVSEAIKIEKDAKAAENGGATDEIGKEVGRIAVKLESVLRDAQRKLDKEIKQAQPAEVVGETNDKN
jgi:hypothetical protein